METNNSSFQLTQKQNYAFQQMLSGKNIFLTGQAGVGKSFIINYFIRHFRENVESEKKRLFVTSLTGISALIIGGQTIHRFCGIGLGDKPIDELVKHINRHANVKERYMVTKVLIIDEISMMNPELFDKIDLIFRKVRKNDAPFGGIQLILSGDLLQLPPVNSNEFVFDAFNWDDVIQETIYLDEVMRQNEGEFIQVLNKIRMGTIDDQVRRVLQSRQNIEVINDFGILPSRLFSRRNRVKEINDMELNRLIQNSEPMNTFKAEYTFSKNIIDENKDFMKNLINESTDIEDDLVLTKKCQVMLKINLPDLRLANGSRGVIVDFNANNNNPIVQFLDGRCIEIQKHSWRLDDNKDTVSKSQIPLELAFAISIHKSQGSTLEYVILDLGSDIFECGQTYVALSRVKSLDGLFIQGDIAFNRITANQRVLAFYQRLV